MSLSKDGLTDNLTPEESTQEQPKPLKSKPLKLVVVGIAPHDGIFSIGVSPHGLISIGAIPHGLIAIGLVPMGVISIGLVSMGIFSTGLITMGLLTLGQINMGLHQLNPIEMQQQPAQDTPQNHKHSH
jgi:GLTT repeat (6 copies)